MKPIIEGEQFVFTKALRSKTDSHHMDQINQAISLINRHQEEKYSFLKMLSSNKKLYNYRSHVFQIKQIHLQQTIKIQLLPNNQQIYKTSNPIFKKVVKQNISTGRSGLTKSCKSSQYLEQIQQNCVAVATQEDLKYEHEPSNRIQKLQLFLKNFRGGLCEVYIGYQNMENGGDIKKYKITTQKIINFQLQNRNKKWIFIKTKSKSQLSMFTLRVQYQIQTKKMKTEISLIDISPSKSLSKSMSKSKSRAKINSLNCMKQLKSVSLSNKQLTQSKDFEQFTKIQQFKKSQRVFSIQNLKKTGSTQLELSPNQKLNKSMNKKQIQQRLKLKRQQFDKKQAQIYRKKEAMQQAREKQIKIKGMALQAKKLIQIYKQIHRQEQQNIKQLVPKLATLTQIVKFQTICKNIILDRQKGFKMAWKTRILTKKFTKILKRNYYDAIKHIDGYKKRELVNVICLTSFFAKMMYKQCEDNSIKMLYQCVINCKPILRINQAFDSATKYRRALRVVQRSWLLKYNAKMYMFKHYVNEQVQGLLKKYPHFKHVYSKFLAQNTAHNLSYKYIGDQTSKIRSTLEDYQQKLKQIQEFNRVNSKIQAYNDSNLKKYQKQLLQIPKAPCKPYDRYFRNISFLKSMVRGWFQVEYRKWAKTNESYLNSMKVLVVPAIKYRSPIKKGSR